VEKLQRLNWATHFLTAEYNGEIPLMFLSEWSEIPSAPFLVIKKKPYASSRPDVVEIAHVT